MPPADNTLLPQPQPQPQTATLAPLLVLPLPVLVRFGRLMRAEGWEVDLQRMCVDDGYALDCLAAGHCSSDARLRDAAVGLFAAFHRNTGQPEAVH